MLLILFSKYAWAKPLKCKNEIEVSKAFEEIINDAITIGHKSPDLLRSDKGLEFTNKEYYSLMKKYNIKLYHTENEEKSSIIERYSRTQNNRMKIIFEINNNFKWIDSLDKIFKDYHNSNHRIIGMEPIEVNKSNEQSLFNSVYSYDICVKIIKTKFKIRDRVRIPAFKKSFENKYSNNWSREIVIVNEINDTNPINYKLKNLNDEEIIGSLYVYELKKTALLFFK